MHCPGACGREDHRPQGEVTAATVNSLGLPGLPQRPTEQPVNNSDTGAERLCQLPLSLYDKLIEE